jgi:hypothetical protein
VTLVERLGPETGYPVDRVLEDARERGVVLRRCDDERVCKFQPTAELFGAAREAVRRLDIAVV